MFCAGISQGIPVPLLWTVDPELRGKGMCRTSITKYHCLLSQYIFLSLFCY